MVNIKTVSRNVKGSGLAGLNGIKIWTVTIDVTTIPN